MILNATRVVTKEELATKNTTTTTKDGGGGGGENGGGELWLSILGEVYNVTAGRRYYGENASYHVFAGRDGSAAFVTGNFTPEGAEVSLYEALSPEELSQLETWREFYAKEDKYPFVGVLEGELYDAEGKPTDEMRRVAEKMEEGKRKMEERTRINREKAAERKKAREEQKRLKEQQQQAAAEEL